MPTLAETSISRPSSTIGSDSAAPIFSATDETFTGSFTPSIMMVNSSPQRRVRVAVPAREPLGPFGDGLQDAIPGSVSETVVDLLEAVEIEKQQPHHGL